MNHTLLLSASLLLDRHLTKCPKKSTGWLHAPLSNCSFGTDVGEQTLDLGIGHGVALGEVAHGGT